MRSLADCYDGVFSLCLFVRLGPKRFQVVTVLHEERTKIASDVEQFFPHDLDRPSFIKTDSEDLERQRNQLEHFDCPIWCLIILSRLDKF
jgi:hypothetical protein